MDEPAELQLTERLLTPAEMGQIRGSTRPRCSDGSRAASLRCSAERTATRSGSLQRTGSPDPRPSHRVRVTAMVRPLRPTPGRKRKRWPRVPVGDEAGASGNGATE